MLLRSYDCKNDFGSSFLSKNQALLLVSIQMALDFCHRLDGLKDLR